MAPMAQVAPLQLSEQPLDVRSFRHKSTLLRQRASTEPQWHQGMIGKEIVAMTPTVNDIFIYIYIYTNMFMYVYIYILYINTHIWGFTSHGGSSVLTTHKVMLLSETPALPLIPQGLQRVGAMAIFNKQNHFYCSFSKSNFLVN